MKRQEERATRQPTSLDVSILAFLCVKLSQIEAGGGKEKKNVKKLLSAPPLPLPEQSGSEVFWEQGNKERLLFWEVLLYFLYSVSCGIHLLALF